MRMIRRRATDGGDDDDDSVADYYDDNAYTEDDIRQLFGDMDSDDNDIDFEGFE